MSLQRIRVITPSRLHFGLLALPNAEAPNHRQFGGVGLMIDDPGVSLTVESATEWSGDGPGSGRAIAFAKPLCETPLRIVVERAPPEHSGLGVGTQLGLAVARVIEELHGRPARSAVELAAMVSRGERSAIGIHGFDRGGFLVDGGKLPTERVSPLVARHPFPPDWGILLVTPSGPAAWHGSVERQAFEALSQTASSHTDSLCRLLVMGLLPAIASTNVEAFGEALYEYNARVGDLFAPAQGGRYASTSIAEVVGRLRSEGLAGVGQSSWGPTVFAIIPPDQTGRDWVSLVSGWGCGAMVTRASNTGARVERVERQ